MEKLEYIKPQLFEKFLLKLFGELGYKIKCQNTSNDNCFNIV